MKYFKEYLNNKVICCLKKFNFESPILEVGCGTGEILEAVSKIYDIKGIDLSDTAIDICRRKGLKAARQNLFDVSKRYNSVICVDVIEHIENDRSFVEHLNKILNEGGKAFAFVPSGRMMQDDRLYGHYRRYSKSAIVKLMEDGGFVVESVKMFGYPIVYYLRIFMNSIYKLRFRGDNNLEANTLRSSYENPFDNSICAKVLRVPAVSRLVSRFLSIQEAFAKGNKGFAVIVIARKPPCSMRGE